MASVITIEAFISVVATYIYTILREDMHPWAYCTYLYGYNYIYLYYYYYCDAFKHECHSYTHLCMYYIATWINFQGSTDAANNYNHVILDWSVVASIGT